MVVPLPIKIYSEDFLSSGIFLVYPKGLQYKKQYIEDLLAFYKAYSYIIPLDIEIFWIIKKEEYRTEILENFAKRRKQKFFFYPKVTDIWAGDWIPFLAKTAKYKQIGVQFHYTASVNDSLCGKTIYQEKLKLPVYKVPLKLDGGNFEFYSNKFIIVTDKIFTDNPKYSEDKIISLLKEIFGVKLVYQLKSRSVLGHTDIFLRHYYDEYYLYSIFNNKVDENLYDILYKIKYDIGLEIVGLPNELSGKKLLYSGQEDYTGNILDFIIVGNNVIFPIFSSSSWLAFEKIREVTPEYVNLIPWEDDVLSKLYQLGGGLYCISNTY